MKIKKFLKEYHFEDWYLSNIAPAEMMKDLVVIHFCYYLQNMSTFINGQNYIRNGGLFNLELFNGWWLLQMSKYTSVDLRKSLQCH